MAFETVLRKDGPNDLFEFSGIVETMQRLSWANEQKPKQSQGHCIDQLGTLMVL